MTVAIPTDPGAAPSPVAPIAGFWRRTMAILLDAVLLWAVGYLLGACFGVWLSRLGQWGTLLGFGIVLGYFGVLNSRVGKGQTLGKRLSQIQVVGTDGKWITLPRSLTRAALLVGTRFLDPLSYQPVEWSLPGMLVNLLTTSFDIGIIYLYLFNRPTRQALHDLIARTCVVRAPLQADITVPRLARIHLVVSGAILLLLTVVWTLVVKGIVFQTVMAMTRTSQTLQRFPEVRKARMGIDVHYEGRKKTFEGVTTTVALQDRLSCGCSGKGTEQFHRRPDCQCSQTQPSGVPLKSSPGTGRPSRPGYGYDPRAGETINSPQSARACACSPEGHACGCVYQNQPGCPCEMASLLDRVAGVVLDLYPEVGKQDQITIQLVYGWDIGLGSGLVGYPASYTLSPEQWRKRLQKL